MIPNVGFYFALLGSIGLFLGTNSILCRYNNCAECKDDWAKKWCLFCQRYYPFIAVTGAVFLLVGFILILIDAKAQFQF